MNIIITGATSGIGKATATLFLKKKHHVILVGRNIDPIKDLLADFEKSALFFKADITSDSDIYLLKEFAYSKFPIIDLFVNNAGVWFGGALHNTKESEWDTLFNVNVKSIMLSARHFIPKMIEQRKGILINTSSVSGLMADYQMAAYNATKGAVHNLTQAMALDYGKYGIRVNSVSPSACATPMFLDGNDRESQNRFKNASPLNRLCFPEDVAQAIYFLASNSASFINGADIPLSGGMHIHTGQPH